MTFSRRFGGRTKPARPLEVVRVPWFAPTGLLVEVRLAEVEAEAETEGESREEEEAVEGGR